MFTPPWRTPTTIRSRLIAIVAASMGPTLSLVLLAGFGLRDAAQDMTVSEAARTLEAVSARQSLIIKHAEQMLRTIAESREAKQGTNEELSEFLESLILRNTLYSTILAAEPEGKVVAAGIPVRNYSLADRQYFGETLEYRNFVVGPIVTSRSTGVPVIPTALPVINEDGSLRYILIAAIRISAISDSFNFNSFTIPAGSELELSDRDGKRIIRVPADPRYPMGAQVAPEFLTDSTARKGFDYLGMGIRVDVSQEPAFRVGMRLRTDLTGALGLYTPFRLTIIAAVSAAASIFLANYLYSRSVGKRIQALTQLAESIGGIGNPIEKTDDGARNELAILERTLRQSSKALLQHERGLREAADAVRRSLREKEVLLKEIHHRVKNNFQVISSLISLQSMVVEDEEVLRMFEASRSRIHSMALIHEQLYQSENLSMIDFGDYARTLADQVALAYRDKNEGLDVQVISGRSPLSLETAVPLGLILNELVSNSFKHAFPEEMGGIIRIALSSPATGQGRLTVTDDGVGLPLDPTERRPDSLGLELIETLTAQLRGALHAGSACLGSALRGAEFTIDFPLPPDFHWTNPVPDSILTE